MLWKPRKGAAAEVFHFTPESDLPLFNPDVKAYSWISVWNSSGRLMQTGDVSHHRTLRLQTSTDEWLCIDISLTHKQALMHTEYQLECVCLCVPLPSPHPLLIFSSSLNILFLLYTLSLWRSLLLVILRESPFKYIKKPVSQPGLGRLDVILTVLEDVRRPGRVIACVIAHWGKVERYKVWIHPSSCPLGTWTSLIPAWIHSKNPRPSLGPLSVVTLGFF